MKNKIPTISVCIATINHYDARGNINYSDTFGEFLASECIGGKELSAWENAELSIESYFKSDGSERTSVTLRQYDFYNFELLLLMLSGNIEAELDGVAEKVSEQIYAYNYFKN